MLIEFSVMQSYVLNNKEIICLELKGNFIFNTISVKNKINPLLYVSDDGENYSLIDAKYENSEIKVDNLAARFIKLISYKSTDKVDLDIIIENRQTAGKTEKITETGEEIEVNFAKKNFYSYLAIGQSNMSGRAELCNEDFEIVPHTYLLNPNEKWEILKCGALRGEMQGFNRYSSVETSGKINKLSPANTFIKVLKMQYPEKAIGLISNAIGGTSIESWQKGSIESNYYKEAVRRTKEAMKTSTLKGIIWHQGESDQAGFETYLAEFSKIANDLRNDFGIPDLPVIAGQILPAKSKDFNNEIMKIKNVILYSDCVSSEGTTDIGDQSHFDTESQHILGRRYAEKMIAAETQRSKF